MYVCISLHTFARSNQLTNICKHPMIENKGARKIISHSASTNTYSAVQEDIMTSKLHFTEQKCIWIKCNNVADEIEYGMSDNAESLLRLWCANAEQIFNDRVLRG